MTRRPVRIALFCLGILLSSGLGYRVWLDEQALTATRAQSVTLERTAEELQTGLANLRAALHAAVAASQEASGWIARATAQIDSLRPALVTLDTAVAASGGSVADALDSLDQLTAAKKRVQADVESGQPLLAADVIFTEMPALLDAAGRQIVAARQMLQRDEASQLSSLRRRQAAEVAVAFVLWLAVAVLLVPVPADAKAVATSETAMRSASTAGLDLSLARLDVEADESGGENSAPGGIEPVRAVAPAPPALSAVAEICTDLSSLSDQEALASALARACGLLGATGAIVWIAAHDGQSLSPGLAHGYNPRVVGRIGAIPADGANLTASTFRDGQARVTPAAGSTPAALAVPMIGPAGPVGVLSAELHVEHPADGDLVALGTIFAAQLATLTLPGSANAERQDPRHAQA